MTHTRTRVVEIIYEFARLTFDASSWLPRLVGDLRPTSGALDVASRRRTRLVVGDFRSTSGALGIASLVGVARAARSFFMFIFISHRSVSPV